MEASYVYMQARLDSFQPPVPAKSRRTSSRSKKAPSKATKGKGGWPLAAPSAQDLAYAGFVWKPTSASPDNVQCFACNCQLDGWEESDVAAYEHLTHSPSCGFAVVTCIRLRTGDSDRTEEDPLSEQMLQARRDTFGTLWPLDSAAGFPSVDQMAAAGWYYDPTEDTHDGVTCPYCSLSLDAWDAGDDALEEHRRRAPDCLFFALNELYHPPPQPEPKKGKRASARTSTASTASTKVKKAAPKAASKAASKTAPKAVPRLSPETSPTPPKISPESPSRSSPKSSPIVAPMAAPVIVPKTAPKAAPKATTKAAPKTAPKTKPKTSPEPAPEPAPKPVLKAAPKTASEAAPVKRTSTRTSNASYISRTQAKKRASEEVEAVEESPVSQKRHRYSSVSSLPDDLLAGTPKRTPPDFAESEDEEEHEMSSFPASLLVGTPKKTPTHLRETDEEEHEMSSFPASLPVGTPKKTPTHLGENDNAANPDAWQPIDIDNFFGSAQEVGGFMNDILVDAGLDDIVAAGGTAEDLQAAVLAGLTESEKKMTIEKWVLYNAKRGEEKLRVACEKQMVAFEAEVSRARAVLESIPTY